MKDRYGNPLTTTSATARDEYVEGLDRFLAASPDVLDHIDAAIAADDRFAMAHLLRARQLQMLGRMTDMQAALARAMALAPETSAQEQAGIAALALLLSGKPAEARAAIYAHVRDYPRDALITQPCMGVFGLIGFSGEAGREAEQLAYTTALAPHYGDDWWFLSGHAFAQMEVGQLGPAERSIEAALAGNPQSANSAHYRSHLYYEAGEAEAGLAYIDDWMQGYAKAGLLHCHISWHIALWELAAGNEARMWKVIDADITPGRAGGPAINVLTDMAAILYRAELAGVEVPTERWRIVSEYAATCFPNPGMTFADVHAALAHAMAGKGEALTRLMTDAKGPAADAVSRLARSFGALAKGAWAEATAHLTTALTDHERIGGSRAQRDLIELAMCGALLKQGRGEEATRLLTIRRPMVAQGAVAGLA
ncbi:MAG: tetratricopeptide repeat protein [Pseudomonadota bacterium]